MAAPIIRDNLFVVLSPSNNWVSSGQLNAPINNRKKCRFISNYSCIIKTNFTQDVYIMDSQNPVATRLTGLAFTGDEKTWFSVRDINIQKPQISLYSPPQLASGSLPAIQINVQFI